ncbi:MAG TPA: hypothetical protein DCG75_14505 [Bacteroidales bacterium]|nr:hypothetical protein [Bacteroidales bacterium]
MQWEAVWFVRENVCKGKVYWGLRGIWVGNKLFDKPLVVLDGADLLMCLSKKITSFQSAFHLVN